MCVVVVSLHMEYGWELSLLCFLFDRGFLHQEFANRCEIWHEASPISQTDQTDHLKFWGQYPQGLWNCGPFFSFRALYGGMRILLTNTCFHQFVDFCLQCFNTVLWISWRASGLCKLTDEVRWMCGIKLQDRVPSKGLIERLGLLI